MALKNSMVYLLIFLARMGLPEEGSETDSKAAIAYKLQTFGITGNFSIFTAIESITDEWSPLVGCLT